MKGLLLKDIINLKQQAKIFLIAAILYLVISFINRDSSIFSIFSVVFTVMVPMTAFAYDERAKWNRYALTMPVSRRDIVLSKYLLAFLFAAVTFLFTFLVSLCMKQHLHDSLISSLTLFLVGLTVSAFVLPIFFKFGVEKGRFILLALVLIPGVLSFLGSKMQIPLPDQVTISILLSIAPFACVLCIIISMLVSIRIYQGKEF